MAKKVLVVDDTKNIRTLLTTCLMLEGYEVDTAIDGDEALQKFQSFKYDLAFVDVRMPQTSGTELLKVIREKNINTPVIIMTAFATVKNAIECTKLGALSYIQKPFTANKVRALLTELGISKEEVGANEMIAPVIENRIKDCNRLLEESRFSEAFEMVKNIFSTNHGNPELYHLLGRLHELKGEQETANKFFKIADILRKN